ncbi:MAG: hypothetical protein J1F13_05655, partial [Prevotellaceae bacterium]|nr:hypothetical protein [Prevotellaceae bacterium]
FLKFHDEKTNAEAQKSRAEAFSVSTHDNCRFALAVVLFVHRSTSDVHDNCSRRLRLSANFETLLYEWEGGALVSNGVYMWVW